jgi:tetratricopeptide (TPR) repeat protein
MQLKKPSRKDKQVTDQKKPLVVNRQPASVAILMPGLIVALAGFILYFNTLNHGFTLDDYSVILENRLTKQGVAAIPEIFSTSYRYGYFFTDDNLYRPLSKAMFAMEWEMSPNDPFPGHLINVLLFALTGFVLFGLMMKISNGHLLFSFLAAMFFVAHPVHTEVVASIKSRDEILAFLFGIAALDRWMAYLRDGKQLHLITAVSCFFIALLSKESSITFLAIFPVAGWFFTGSAGIRLLKSSAPFMVAAAAFLLIRAQVLEGIMSESVSVADNHLMAAENPLIRFANAVYVLGLYLIKLVLPHPLAFDHSYNQIPLIGTGNWKFILSALIHTGLLIYAILRFSKKDIISFFILFYLITISVSSNIFMIIGTGFAERLLYTPSLAYSMAVAFMLIKAGKIEWQSASGKLMDQLKSAPVLSGLFLILFLAYSVKLTARNGVWKDNYTLYSTDVLNSPNSTRTHYYLGNYLVKPEAWEGQSEEVKRATLYKGIASLKRSVEIYPRFADAYTQMGVAYYKLNNLDSALICYNQSLAINPGNPTVQNNIGTIYFTAGRHEESLKYFMEATRLNPSYAEAHMNTGSAYGMLKQYDAAIQSLLLSVKYDPNNAQSYYFLGLTYGFKGDQQNAGLYLEKAYALNPSLRPAK